MHEDITDDLFSEAPQDSATHSSIPRDFIDPVLQEIDYDEAASSASLIEAKQLVESLVPSDLQNPSVKNFVSSSVQRFARALEADPEAESFIAQTTSLLSGFEANELFATAFKNNPTSQTGRALLRVAECREPEIQAALHVRFLGVLGKELEEAGAETRSLSPILAPLPPKVDIQFVKDVLLSYFSLDSKIEADCSTNICDSYRSLAGPAALVVGENYEALSKETGKEDLYAQFLLDTLDRRLFGTDAFVSGAKVADKLAVLGDGEYLAEVTRHLLRSSAPTQISRKKMTEILDYEIEHGVEQAFNKIIHSACMREGGSAALEIVAKEFVRAFANEETSTRTVEHILVGLNTMASSGYAGIVKNSGALDHIDDVFLRKREVSNTSFAKYSNLVCNLGVESIRKHEGLLAYIAIIQNRETGTKRAVQKVLEKHGSKPELKHYVQSIFGRRISSLFFKDEPSAQGKTA